MNRYREILDLSRRLEIPLITSSQQESLLAENIMNMCKSLLKRKMKSHELELKNDLFKL